METAVFIQPVNALSTTKQLLFSPFGLPSLSLLHSTLVCFAHSKLFAPPCPRGRFSAFLSLPIQPRNLPPENRKSPQTFPPSSCIIEAHARFKMERRRERTIYIRGSPYFPNILAAGYGSIIMAAFILQRSWQLAQKIWSALFFCLRRSLACFKGKVFSRRTILNCFMKS